MTVRGRRKGAPAAARRREYAATAVRAEHLDDHPLPEILRRYMVELAQLSTRTRAESAIRRR